MNGDAGDGASLDHGALQDRTALPGVAPHHHRRHVEDAHGRAHEVAHERGGQLLEGETADAVGSETEHDAGWAARRGARPVSAW